MRTLIFGNSGAGKSTLARKLAKEHGLAHLDLDILAWLPSSPPKRRPLQESTADILAFIEANPSWVIEGCYSDLLELAMAYCTEIIFLNPGVEKCIAHCRLRPWEPHKYKSKAEQDANLDMLIRWIRDYENRQDEFSLAAHRRIYEQFRGTKRELR